MHTACWCTQACPSRKRGIAVDAASGSCLGLVGGDVWSRDGVNPIPHRAVHWLDTAEQAKTGAEAGRDGDPGLRRGRPKLAKPSIPSC
jgi:hypothetical protein